jgi:hypothetical protein
MQWSVMSGAIVGRSDHLLEMKPVMKLPDWTQRGNGKLYGTRVSIDHNVKINYVIILTVNERNSYEE